MIMCVLWQIKKNNNVAKFGWRPCEHAGNEKNAKIAGGGWKEATKSHPFVGQISPNFWTNVETPRSLIFFIRL